MILSYTLTYGNIQNYLPKSKNTVLDFNKNLIEKNDNTIDFFILTNFFKNYLKDFSKKNILKNLYNNLDIIENHLRIIKNNFEINFIQEVKIIQDNLKNVNFQIENLFENILLDFFKIKNMIEYLLSNELIFRKYGNSAIDLVHNFKLLFDCYSSQEDEKHKYYENFSEDLNKKFQYFNKNIYESPAGMTNNVREFTNIIMR